MEIQKESKREAFLRLAEKRTNAVIKKIQILSNCSNPYAYDYNDEDVRKIFAAIEEEMRIAKLKFARVAHEPKEFKLR